GTLGYMSPEQLDGQVVDGRADVFACGVVLHECVRLKRLWKALDVPAMKAARAQPIPPLDEHDDLCKRALAQEITAADLSRMETNFSRAQLAALVPPPPPWEDPARITRTLAPPRRRRSRLPLAA